MVIHNTLDVAKTVQSFSHNICSIVLSDVASLTFYSCFGMSAVMH